MRPSSLAIDLEDQAAVLRRMAAGIRSSGRPITVAWEGHTKDLFQLTSLDLEADAHALERDAHKLRTIYS